MLASSIEPATGNGGTKLKRLSFNLSNSIIHGFVRLNSAVGPVRRIWPGKPGHKTYE